MRKAFISFFLFCSLSMAGQIVPHRATLQVLYSPGKPINVFIPSRDFGAGFDGHEKGETRKILLPENIRTMLSSGYGPLTYRLRTELANEVWHWNPRGTWSDPKNKRGYWISSDDPNDFISLSHSYRLPRRGNTFDQADDDGYSRITDGNEKTFWKSNPYLDEYYSDSKKEIHPQWVVVDLGREEDINAIRINWAPPFAVSFTVDFASPPIYDYFTNWGYYETADTGLWKPFPHHIFTGQTGNASPLRLCEGLTRARFIRIRMTVSSHSGPGGSTDTRDSLGFAIREIFIGRLNSRNFFKDLVHHKPNKKRQSKVYVSSTDCWHRAIDMNKETEQAGIDRIYQSGMTHYLPALIPVGVLYDNPDNALALIRYLHKKNYAVEGIELGEEADGQSATPEDYAALYYQWTKKIRGQYPDLSLGGPSLETIIIKWPGERFSTREWLNRFYTYLEQHRAAANFNFLSFEWYPYDDICDPPAPQLADAAALLLRAMSDVRETKIPQSIPLYISEYGYSAFPGRSEVAIEGALMNADIVGQFLAGGGKKAYLYGLEPGELDRNQHCGSFGNNMLLGRNERGKIIYKTATYYSLQMLTNEWARPVDSPVEVYPVRVNEKEDTMQHYLSCYALHCSDNNWSLLLINKDPLNSCDVEVLISDQSTHFSSPIRFPVFQYQYSGKQYQWREKGDHGFPLRELPPERKILNEKSPLLLPPYSMTIVREIKDTGNKY